MKKNFHLIIGLLILTVLVFAVYNISQLQSEIGEKQYNDLVNDLSSITNNFSIWISNKKDMLNTSKDVIDNFAYEEITRWSTANPYLNINNEDPDVSQVYIGLSDGRFITGGNWVPPEDYDPRTRVWYQDALEANETIVSKVYVDLETGDQLVTISSPLYMDGTFVGVISADVFLNNIHGYLEKLISEDNIYTYLLDQEGTIIVHTDKASLVGQNLYRDIKHEVFIDYFEQVKNGNETVRMEYVYNGDDIRGILQKVESGDWYLSVASINDNRIDNDGSVKIGNLVINALAMLIMLILIYMIIKMKRELDGLNELLTHENEKDFLTGIYNRRYFNLYLEKLWTTDSSEKEVSLLIMDIDKFKEYNDTYGHIQGDEVLKAVTGCISNHIRKGDVFSRYGGEEFSLVLVGVSGDSAKKVANTVKDEVYNENIDHKSSPFGRITISIGVTTVTPNGEISIRDTIDHADSALYQAKDDGRNSVRVWKEQS